MVRRKVKTENLKITTPKIIVKKGKSQKTTIERITIISLKNIKREEAGGIKIKRKLID